MHSLAVSGVLRPLEIFLRGCSRGLQRVVPYVRRPAERPRNMYNGGTPKWPCTDKKVAKAPSKQHASGHPLWVKATPVRGHLNNCFPTVRILHTSLPKQMSEGSDSRPACMN
eukprot:gnl/TRDRNA2_/TRDRNA2_98807_c1_seq1.p1 gnl/TRDRNA2_/TRDRNA2_98807_c1~~gnl/TRDRNA2_/TRDRNA2_98807_c1_seq1.p1  ORF type:complete len:112 (+),score=2.55 gnl/TRDRNA2_/TRDRNA2_98807_c1_seq1:33-368(+)